MVDLKDMEKKEKIKYIWDYYKFHILGGLAAIFIIGSIIHGQITKVNYVFNLTLVGNSVEESKRDNLQQQITSMVVNKGDKKHEALVDVIPVGSEKDSANAMSAQLMQKFMTELSVQNLDLVVIDKSTFDSLVNHDTFLRLDNRKDIDLNSIENKKIEASGSNNNEGVYAISAENIKILKDMEFDTKNKVVAVIATSKQVDKAVSVLKWIVSI